MNKTKFNINKLHASVNDEEILKGVTMSLKSQEVHAVMGPNGSGKSTLSKVIMGHPSYKVTGGEVLLDGKNILNKSPETRSQLGIFLAFQYPIEVPGVNMFSYLRTIYSRAHRFDKEKNVTHPGSAKKRGGNGGGISVEEFEKIIHPLLKKLTIKEDFLERSLNEGFSGGEKKKAEIIQLALLQPKVIILDETDSGLDVDALRMVAKGIEEVSPSNSIILIITHYQRILRYIKPDFVHVMMDGRIVESGGYELAERIERGGYKEIKSKIKMKSQN